MPRRLFAALAAMLMLSACGQGSAAATTQEQTAVATGAPAPEPSPTVQLTAAPEPTATPAPAPTAAPSPAPAPTAAGAAAPISLEPLADGFTRPATIANAGDGSGRLFIVEQGGAIWIVRDGERLEQPFLDIGELVSARGNEQGLLGLAFHPRYAESGLLFVYYTDTDGDDTLARYRVSENADAADQGSAVVLLSVEDPAANHNGGQLAFGPDGYLYVALGDGGGGGDSFGNGQNLGTLLGSILRIDVDGEGDHEGRPYGIPADNPFVGREDARPEIWAWGLRNPWRFSFDRETGDLYIADVGQNAVEEVNVQPAGSPGGENYGWNTMEGADCFRAQRCDQSGLTLPAATYRHGSDEGGCSITGGYVYRGQAMPQLAGAYLYSDYCTGNLWALRRAGGGWDNQLLGRLDMNPSSFGEDEAGELYVADHRGGVVYRVAAE